LIVAAGIGACAAVAGPVSVASAEDPSPADVELTVDIGPTEGGVLALTVAADTVPLTEDGSSLDRRQFVGALPTVTVTDTRTPDEIPDGSAWAVLGTAADFTGPAGTVSAGHLGWSPHLVDGDEAGLVQAGEEVVTVLDADTQPGNAVGLVDQELLASTFASATTAGGTYQVDAELFLRTPADVAAGSYTSTLTLSLFE